MFTDYVADRRLDEFDIDAFAAAIRNNSASVTTHDLDGDQDVDVDDLIEVANLYAGKFVGDSDLDGLFNSSVVWVMLGGKYDSGQAAGWVDGDWIGDGLFDSGDQVFTFQQGGYGQNKWQCRS